MCPSCLIIGGSTHAVYYKTLKHALGIQAVTENIFRDTIHAMHPIVKALLNEICEVGKQEMKDKKEHELGSW